MDRSKLKQDVEAARAALQAAEQALADSYGPIVDQVAAGLRSMFSPDELRRWARHAWDLEEGLPSAPASARELSRAVVLALIDRYPRASRPFLRASLVTERPRRQAEIDLMLEGWDDDLS